MAEKSEDKCSVEEKITQAKELIARGTRNYFIDAYADAADDLSQACSIYATLFGQNADELGRPYLLYAKSLIAVAQDENKLMEIPEEDEGNEDEDEGDNEDEADKSSQEPEAEGSVEPENLETEDGLEKENKTDEEKVDAISNGHANKSEVDCSSAAVVLQPESSTSNGKEAVEPVKDGGDAGDEEETKDDDEDDSTASLQVAWEVLELAVKIFEKQGDSALPNLADAHNELANISFENSFFTEAINDYTKSYEIYLDLPEPNRRILAELQYKVGLCHVMLNDFENSVKSLKKSCVIFDEEIAAEKAKENQSDDVQKTIKDLEETKQEILNKIIDVEESKQQSTEEVKRELAKLIATKNGGGDGNAGPSSSSSSSAFALPSTATGFSDGGSSSSSTTTSDVNKPKPSDISHLIKRKKPSEDKPAEQNSNAPADDAVPPPTKKPSL